MVNENVVAEAMVYTLRRRLRFREIIIQPLAFGEESRRVYDES